MASQVDAVEREFLLCARYGELEEMLEELVIHELEKIAANGGRC